MACLYLVPNALDHGAEPVPLDEVLPRDVIARAATLGHWVAEDAKSARAFLKRVAALVPLSQPIAQVQIVEWPRPAKGSRGPSGREADQALRALIKPLLQGHDMGLISEAGLPAVADPGSELVALAHQLGAKVVPLTGPSSLMLALAASGLHGQSFAFVGYLPQEPAARAQRLRELCARSRAERQTQIMIETPYRNAAFMAALVEHLPPSVRLGVACGISLPQGWCRTATVAQWRQAAPIFEKGLPAVFSILA
jgi:16S rRNA (cytidine1402-2'-O)-methyltransferase